MTTLLLCLAGVLVLFFLIAYGTTMARVMSIRVREVRGPRRVDPAEVPIDELMSLQDAGHQLETLGFERIAVLEEEIPFEGGGSPAASLVYLDRERRSFAVLSMVGGPNRWQAFQVGFASFAADGSALETVSHAAHLMPFPSEGHHLIDALTPSLREQWQRHQKEVSEHATFVSTIIDIDRAIARLRTLRKGAFRGQVERGELAPREDTAGGGYHFTFRGALASIRRASAGENARLKAYAAAEKQAMKTAGQRGVAPATGLRRDVTPELVAFQRRDGIETQRSSGWQKKLLFFAVSLALFGVAFGIQLNVATVLILIGVLFFHEMGHALAMRAFGYRDLQILFIPFLGAVASGTKQRTKPLEEIVVLLAGPMPGIALGTLILMMGWGESLEWVQHTALMLLILNFLNLLPIVPLDGGRVMNIVLFDRFPSLQLAFAGVSAAGLALAGRVMDDNVLFGVGIALMVGLPTQLKQNQLLKAARRTMRAPEDRDGLGAGLDPEAPLRTIFAELLKPQFDKWNGETRYQLVRQLRDRLARRPAGWGVALVGMTAYVLCFTVPVGALAYGAFLQMEAASEQFDAEYARSVEEWDARIAASEDDTTRAMALYQAGQHFFDLEFDGDAHGYLLRAAELLDGGESPELEASTHLLLGQIYWEGEDDASATMLRMRRHLDRALALREPLHGPESLEVAEVLEQMGSGFDVDPGEQMATQLRLVAIYEATPEQHPGRTRLLVQALQGSSRLHLSMRETDAAVAALQRAAELAAKDPALDGSSHERVLDQLSKLYFARHRYDEVAALLDRRAALIARSGEALDYARPSLEGDRAWLAYWRGDYARAGAGFEGLRAQAEEVQLPIFGSDMVFVPLLVSQATAAAGAGDNATALALLDRTRSALEDQGRSLPDYIDQLRPVENQHELSPGVEELLRRQSEQARVLLPLVASL